MSIARPKGNHFPVPKAAQDALMISIHDVYPFTDGGMAVAGRRIADLIATKMPVHILTNKGLRLTDAYYWRADVCGLGFDSFINNVSWRGGEYARRAWLRWYVRSNIRRQLAKLSPSLCFFNQFEGFAPEVLDAIVGCAAPKFARFGDRHGGVLLDVINSRKFLRQDLPIAHLDPVSGLMTAVFNCDFLRRYYSGQVEAAGIKSLVIYDGIDSDEFHPSERPPTQPIFVYMSRTLEKKGFLQFCQTMAILPANVIAGIHIIGDGEDLQKGVSIIKDAGRGHLLELSGYADRQEVAERLRLASIFVLPSWDEGLPAAVIESMATGLAVICSNVGGVPEVVEDGKTGKLVEPKNLQQLVAACRGLAEDESLRQRLARAGRQIMVDKFRRSQGLYKYQMLIEKMLDPVNMCVRSSGIK